MPELSLPSWPKDWVIFADWRHLGLAGFGVVLLLLLGIWWRQQTRYWFRIMAGTFLAALLLCIGSYYMFVTPPYYAGCPLGCPGRRGYPLPFARMDMAGGSQVAFLDFMLNLLMLWLLWLGASLVWRLLGLGFQWWSRSWRAKLVFIVFTAILPWALLPRVLDPPQPHPDGEDLRLAVNAQRSAEYTYRITGAWVQRLALEDIRHTALEAGGELPFGEGSVTEVCLRGYTYFYVPWRRYRITLDPGGVTALSLHELSLEGSCWGE